MCYGEICRQQQYSRQQQLLPSALESKPVLETWCCQCVHLSGSVPTFLDRLPCLNVRSHSSEFAVRNGNTNPPATSLVHKALPVAIPSTQHRHCSLHLLPLLVGPTCCKGRAEAHHNTTKKTLFHRNTLNSAILLRPRGGGNEPVRRTCTKTSAAVAKKEKNQANTSQNKQTEKRTRSSSACSTPTSLRKATAQSVKQETNRHRFR